jgi:tetratricopeptide (TPR) repeat protein
MSPRGRVFFLVTLAAAVASGIVVIGVLATRSSLPSAPKVRSGAPPVLLDLGVRTDPEARALRRAEVLYSHGGRAQAGAIFGRYRSLEARVGAALAAWPADTVTRLETLASAHPRSAAVALHLGLALYWSGRNAEAATAWRAAKRLQPDTTYAVNAADLLHPQFAPGLPPFVPSFQPPLRVRVLPPPAQLAALARAARGGGARARILYGAALQKLDRQRSAEREFAAAAQETPNDPEARVAAAVGLFDKDDPSRAFAQLGPLTRTFPHAQTVRFHLGELLLWLAQVAQARKELRLARAEAPASPLGREAASYLKALGQVGTR